MSTLDPWGDAIEEAYASAPNDEVILHTLELRHPAFSAPVRVVRDHGVVIVPGDPDIYGHILTLEAGAPVDPSTAVNFVGCMFDFDIPAQEEGKIPEVQVSLDNVTQEIQCELDEAVKQRSPLHLTYREYLLSNVTQPQFILGGLSIKSVRSDVFRVVGSASFTDLVNSSFPKKTYTPNDFQGLRR